MDVYPDDDGLLIISKDHPTRSISRINDENRNDSPLKGCNRKNF